VPTDGQLSRKGGGSATAEAGTQANAPDGNPKSEGSTDAYSTLAVLNLSLNWFSSARIEQFIATGHAARSVEPAVAGAFRKLTTKEGSDQEGVDRSK
jgi:hypothetical protein